MIGIIRDFPTWCDLVVNVEIAVAQLNLVARQPDDPLDVVDSVFWTAEHDNVAAPGLARDYPPFEPIRREGKGITWGNASLPTLGSTE